VYLSSIISENGIVCRAKAQVGVRVASAYMKSLSFSNQINISFY
jgi:hypothetical protein